MSAKFFERVGLNISWFPGHMATAARTIEQRLKVVDMVQLLLNYCAVSVWMTVGQQLTRKCSGAVV